MLPDKYEISTKFKLLFFCLHSYKINNIVLVKTNVFKKMYRFMIFRLISLFLHIPKHPAIKISRKMFRQQQLLRHLSNKF